MTLSPEIIDDRKKMLDEINAKRTAEGLKPLARLSGKKKETVAGQPAAADMGQASIDPKSISEIRQSLFDSLEGIFKIRYSKLGSNRTVALDNTLALAVNYEIQNVQASPRKVLWGTVVTNFCILTLDAIRARRAERQEEKNKDAEPLPAPENLRRSPTTDGPGKYSEIPPFVGALEKPK
jgi:hypothetical protein